MFNINLTALITALSFILFVYFFNKTFWFPIAKVRKQRDENLENKKSKALIAEKQTHEVVETIKAEIESIKKAEHELFEKIFNDIELNKKQAEAELKDHLKLEKQKTFSEIKERQLNLNSVLEHEAKVLSQNIIRKIAPEIALV